MKTKNAIISALIALFLLSACATPISTQGPVETAEQVIAAPKKTSSPKPIVPTQTDTPIVSFEYQFLQIDMLDATHGSATMMDHDGKQLLAITDDGWQTFRNITPTNAIVVEAFYFQTPQIGFALVFPENSPVRLVKTEDGGLNWSVIPNFPENFGANIRFLNDQYGLSREMDGSAGHAYIRHYETTDAGETWSLLPLIPPAPQEGLPEGVVALCNICQDLFEQTEMDSLIVYGEMANEPTDTIKLSVSNDRGLNWAHVELAKPDALTSSLTAPIAARLETNLWVLALGLSSFQNETQTSIVFLESKNQGQTWELLNPKITLPVFPPTNLNFLNSTFSYFADFQNLYFVDLESFDVDTVALNQVLQGFDPDLVNTPLVEFVDRTHGWIILNAEQNTTLFSTADGGASWSPIYPVQVDQP